MKKMTITTLILVGILLCPATLFADAAKSDWYGDWAMNHDGFAGSLRIMDTKADCATTLWCDMAIRYVDSKGVQFTGVITRLDDKGQHLAFYINFPANRQKFDAYIFSWDKGKLAGTTYWGGRTFGFYALRR